MIEMAAAAHIVTGVVQRRPALVRQAGALLQHAKVHLCSLRLSAGCQVPVCVVSLRAFSEASCSSNCCHESSPWALCSQHHLSLPLSMLLVSCTG